MPSTNPIFQGGFQGHFNLFDSRLASLMLQPSDRHGALFRQFPDHVEIHRSLSEFIHFDEVTGAASAMQKDIAASVYDAQKLLFKSVMYEWHVPVDQQRFERGYRKMKLNHSDELAKFYRTGASASVKRARRP